jgi:hypothetical protein
MAASFIFPATVESLPHVPERWTDNGEEFLVPDPAHPFATWAPVADHSSSPLIPPVHLRGIRQSLRTTASMPTSSSADPPLTGEWRHTLPPNPVVSTPRASAPIVAANIPVLPTDLDGDAPGDFGDLFRGPHNGNTIVPAYLELRFPSAALPSRRYA